VHIICGVLAVTATQAALFTAMWTLIYAYIEPLGFPRYA
jgi:hypothetical protein